MGRGRQRAKQRKVARDLKYFSPETDYAALERELASRGGELKDESDQDGSEWDKYDPDRYDIQSSEEDWDEDDWPSQRQ